MRRKLALTMITLSLITSNVVNVSALSQTSKQNINNAVNNYKSVLTLPLSTNRQELLDYLEDIRSYNLDGVGIEVNNSGIHLNLKYFENADEMKVVNRLASLIYYETLNLNPIEKVYYVTQRINGLLDYAESTSEKHIFSPTGVIKGEAVCQGYARLASIIFSKVGIPNSLVEGNFEGSTTPHLWNAVNIHNEWFYVDVTQSDMDDNKTDFNYVLMNNKQLKENGYQITYTRVIGSDSDIQYFKGKGLISTLNKRFYSKAVSENNSILSYSYINKSLDFVDNSDNFWIVEGELFTLKGNKITNVNKGEIYHSYIDDVDGIRESDGGLYYRGSLIYNGSNLPSHMVKPVYSDFKLTITDPNEKNNFYIEETANKTNVYYKNEFLVQYIRK